LRIDGFRFRNELAVPAGIASFVSADEKNTGASRIKDVQDTVGMAFVLYPEFA
jgi:hypothetical protein